MIKISDSKHHYLQWDRISRPVGASSLSYPTCVPGGAIHAIRMAFPINIYLREDEILEVLPGLGEPHYEPIEALVFHTRTTAKYYGDDYAVNEAVNEAETS